MHQHKILFERCFSSRAAVLHIFSVSLDFFFRYFFCVKTKEITQRHFASSSIGSLTKSVLICFGNRPLSFSFFTSSNIDLSVHANTIVSGFSLREIVHNAFSRTFVSAFVSNNPSAVFTKLVEIIQIIVPSSETASYSISPPDCTPNLRFANAW